MSNDVLPGGLPRQPAHPLPLDGAVRLLTEQQAADLAGVHRKTIRRLIEQGRLKAADYGTAGQHNYRIHPCALAELKPARGQDGLPEPITPHVRAGRRAYRSRAPGGKAAAFLPRVSSAATGRETRQQQRA